MTPFPRAKLLHLRPPSHEACPHSQHSSPTHAPPHTPRHACRSCPTQPLTTLLLFCCCASLHAQVVALTDVVSRIRLCLELRRLGAAGCAPRVGCDHGECAAQARDPDTATCCTPPSAALLSRADRSFTHLPLSLGLDHSPAAVDDLKALSNKLNPTLGYWNPTGLADMEFWGQSNEASIGWLRQAEIKHGRVAMMAFVGFLAGSNGIVFPWAQDLDGTTFAKIAEAGGPASQWDALPTQAKLQILGVIGFFEFCARHLTVPSAIRAHLPARVVPPSATCHAFLSLVRPSPLCAPSPRVGEHLRSRGFGREALHARRQARRLPLLQVGRAAAPRALRPLRPARLLEEDGAREEGETCAAGAAEPPHPYDTPHCATGLLRLSLLRALATLGPPRELISFPQSPNSTHHSPSHGRPPQAS